MEKTAENEQSPEGFLPDYFSGRLSGEKKELVEAWRDSSKDNTRLFGEYLQVWESIALLKEMESIDTPGALKSVNRKIENEKALTRFIIHFRRIAAILILPLILYSLFATHGMLKFNSLVNKNIAWQTIQTQSGMHGAIDLPDGSRVTLNSNSELKYPVNFSGKTREVKLIGEAYFDIKKDTKHPFLVKTGGMNVEVLGTTFNVSNYNNAPQEVVLVSGIVRLFTDNRDQKKSFHILKPGQRAIFNKSQKMLSINNVEVDKYISWKDGYIIFRDDPMQVVVQKLERWFNVDIIVEDLDLLDYPITAKFHDETLTQVFTLLKLSSNIEYVINETEKNNNGEYTKTRIYVKKKKR